MLAITGYSRYLMVDSYPIPWMPLAHFSQHMTWARSIAGPAKPLYAIAQAFDWYAFRDAVPGETRFRVPTHEELKCMTYLALAQPVDGLLFFTFASGKWFLPTTPISGMGCWTSSIPPKAFLSVGLQALP